MLYQFAEFRLDAAERVLLRNGQPVGLTQKAFETLLFMVENSGRVVEKRELMKAVWPDSVVEENNVSQNIFVLRRALGKDRNGQALIQTIPRRGFKFVPPVTRCGDRAGAEHSGEVAVSADYWVGRSPFRGLRTFEPEDAWLFFGRDPETQDLRIRLRRAPVLVVVGNSGCGKSSLVRAGLIPALRNEGPRLRQPPEAPVENWRVVLTRPSVCPFDDLAEVVPNQLAPELTAKERAEFIADCRRKLRTERDALRNAVCALVNAAAESSPTRVLLVVDQFEELFTLTDSREERERYIDALLDASRWDGSAPVHLVLILRADFYSQCLEHPGLSRCLQDNLYNVPRMTHRQLRSAIEKRLELAAAHTESGLIESLLDDVGSEPGNLALLEHALSQLWEKCGGYGSTLTHSTYEAIGRVHGALSTHADGVYGGLTAPAQQHLMQKIFLELVHLGRGAPDTRRRVRKEELLSLGTPEEIEPLLERLASCRLITVTGEGHAAFAEVSHEALIREWPKLREWISENREELRLARRLLQLSQEWEGLGREPGALLQGARLVQAEEWLHRNPAAPSLVRRFVEVSVVARKEAEVEKLRKQRTAAARLRWFCVTLGCLLLVALGESWSAHRQRTLAESRALAAQSEEMLVRDHGRALDLALRGWKTARTQETYTAVTKALPQTIEVLQQNGYVIAAAFSPDGQLIVTASYDHTARVWSAADGHLLATLRHDGELEDTEFSPDGQRIVTASADHTARVWSSADGRLLAVLTGHTDKVQHAEFSPDGQRIVTASRDRTARVWSAADGSLTATLLGHTDWVWGATFSPDSRRIVTASLDHTARVWSSADGRPLAILRGHTQYVFDARFSPDSRRVVTSGADSTARLWDSLDGRLLATLRHNGEVGNAAFSADGRSLVTTSQDHTARIWSTIDGRLLATLHHDGVVVDARWFPNGQRIVTASEDGMARVWDTATGRLVATLEGHSSGITTVSLSRSGQYIITGSRDNTARVWNLSGGRLIAALRGHADRVWAAGFSPDGQRIVTVSKDHTARIWNAEDGRLLAALTGHTDSVWQAAFSPDGHRIVTASSDHTARIWSTADGSLLAVLHHEDQVHAVTFSPDGQHVATASDDHTARIWNTVDGRLLKTLAGHTGSVRAVAFSPDGGRVVAAGDDHTARLWNSADGRLLTVLEGHTDRVWSAMFSPDGQRILTTSDDHTARIWRVADGRSLAVLQHEDNVYRATFSPDGQRIVTASYDHTARIWNTADGRLLVTLRGHTNRIQGVAFSPDGQRIATASDDHTAMLWDSADGRLLATLKGHSDQVWAIGFSPDGRRILTASADQTARVWEVLKLDDLDKILVN